MHDKESRQKNLSREGTREEWDARRKFPCFTERFVLIQRIYCILMENVVKYIQILKLGGRLRKRTGSVGEGNSVETSVLVLNASYEAINICNMRRALKMVFKGTAQTEEASEAVIHSPSAVMHVPHVIRLVNYVNVPRSVVKFSRKNVLVRDRHRCQYCRQEFPTALLTLDHVVPLSRGGTTTWENVVTACKKCNNRKGNRLVSESKMWLERQPKTPSILTYLQLNRSGSYHGRGYHPSWKKYLYLNHDYSG